MNLPATRLNPDSRPMILAAVVLTLLLGVVSFALSFAGLVRVAAWAAVPPALSWAVPAVVDGAQLVFTAGALVHRARGERVGRSWAALALFAAVSVAGNALHAWDAGQGDWRAWAGVVIAGLAPLAVVLSVHELASLVVARPAAEAEAVPLHDLGAPLSDVEHDPIRQAGPAFVVERPAEVAPSRDWDDVPLFPAVEAKAVPVSGATDTDERMRELRARGLSIRAIAEAVGLSRSTVSRRLAAVSSAV